MIHRSTHVDLFPLTFFVGANNSGKSALFDALLNFARLSAGPLNANRDLMGTGPYSFRSRSSNEAHDTDAIGYELTVSPTLHSDSRFKYRISYRQTEWDGSRAYYEIFDEFLLDESQGEPIVDRSSEPPIWPPEVPGPEDDQTVLSLCRDSRDVSKDLPDLALLSKTCSQVGKFKLDPKVLRMSSGFPNAGVSSGGTTIRLGYEGENLAALLFRLRDDQPDEFALIVNTLKEAIAGFDTFRFNMLPSKEPDYTNIGFAVGFKDSRGVVDAPNLSDGTLLLIGWIVLLSLPRLHKVLMLEEPEVGLTPAASRHVFDALMRLSRRADGAQVLVSTHSPYLLCWMMGEEGGKDQAYVVSQNSGRAEMVSIKETQEILGRELGGRSSFDISRAALVDEANQILQSL